MAEFVGLFKIVLNFFKLFWNFVAFQNSMTSAEIMCLGQSDMLSKLWFKTKKDT